MPTRGRAGEAAERPEEMPAPPADLRGRVLPIWEGSGPWMRMHAAGRDPLYFGKAGRNRFDDPQKGYGVLYAADDVAGSFVESFGRSPGRNLVSPQALGARSLARIVADRRLRLVDLTGPGLARIGATGAIYRVHGRPPSPGVKRPHQAPHEREVERRLQAAVEVVVGYELFERDVAG